MIFDRHIKFDNEHEATRFDQNKCTYEFAHKIKELQNKKNAIDKRKTNKRRQKDRRRKGCFTHKYTWSENLRRIQEQTII